MPSSAAREMLGQFARSDFTHPDGPVEIDMLRPSGILNSVRSENHKFAESQLMPSTKQIEVEVRLTPDEALVLFESLSRYNDTDELRVEDQAEQRALWNLCCLLEKELVEPFNPDYMELLQSARNRLRDKDDEDSEPGAAPNGGPGTQLGSSGATGGPPSVS